jgi:hypothetical protein
MIRILCEVCGTANDFTDAARVQYAIDRLVDMGDTCAPCKDIEEAARKFAAAESRKAGDAAFSEYLKRARAQGKVRAALEPAPLPVEPVVAPVAEVAAPEPEAPPAGE